MERLERRRANYGMPAALSSPSTGSAALSIEPSTPPEGGVSSKHAPEADARIVSLLRDAKCEARIGIFASDTMSEWSSLLDEGRPAFLKMLASRGVDKLTERQAIANSLGKAKREGRV